MKGFICGAITGGVAGMIAASVFMPYVEPELNHALRKCKRMIRCKVRRIL